MVEINNSVLNDVAQSVRRLMLILDFDETASQEHDKSSSEEEKSIKKEYPYDKLNINSIHIKHDQQSIIPFPYCGHLLPSYSEISPKATPSRCDLLKGTLSILFRLQYIPMEENIDLRMHCDAREGQDAKNYKWCVRPMLMASDSSTRRPLNSSSYKNSIRERYTQGLQNDLLKFSLGSMLTDVESELVVKNTEYSDRNKIEDVLKQELLKEYYKHKRKRYQVYANAVGSKAGSIEFRNSLSNETECTSNWLNGDSTDSARHADHVSYNVDTSSPATPVTKSKSKMKWKSKKTKSKTILTQKARACECKCSGGQCGSATPPAPPPKPVKADIGVGGMSKSTSSTKNAPPQVKYKKSNSQTSSSSVSAKTKHSKDKQQVMFICNPSCIIVKGGHLVMVPPKDAPKLEPKRTDRSSKKQSNCVCDKSCQCPNRNRSPPKYQHDQALSGDIECECYSGTSVARVQPDDAGEKVTPRPHKKKAKKTRSHVAQSLIVDQTQTQEYQETTENTRPQLNKLVQSACTHDPPCEFVPSCFQVKQMLDLVSCAQVPVCARVPMCSLPRMPTREDSCSAQIIRQIMQRNATQVATMIRRRPCIAVQTCNTQPRWISANDQTHQTPWNSTFLATGAPTVGISNLVATRTMRRRMPCMSVQTCSVQDQWSSTNNQIHLTPANSGILPNGAPDVGSSDFKLVSSTGKSSFLRNLIYKCSGMDPGQNKFLNMFSRRKTPT